MAYAVKYLFKFQSSNGTVREIRVLKDGYTGAVIQRPLGRAPVIKKEQNGGVHGTSLTFYAECHVDREFIEFYTSDPKEYRVDVYAGSMLLWQGYITPELYSEPDIAPPYDVQVVATDGVGELKLYDFEPQGTVTLRSLLSYLLGYTGLSTDVNLVSSLKPGSHGAGALLDMQICVDYLEGKTCYEVLTYLLDTLHATITRWGGAWLLVRETNVTYANDKVRYFTTAGNSALLSGSVQTLGSMRSAPAWPVGQLSMVIDPAKNKVAVQAPWHPLTCLANADMTSDTAWAKANNASYGPDGYLLPNNDTGGSSYYTAHISQSFASAGLRVPMTFELKATGVAAQVGARVGAVIGVLITYTVDSTVYLLRRGDEGTPVWKEGREPGASIDGSLIDYQQPLASFDADRIQAETLNINEIPAFVQDTSYPSGTLTVYIIGACARAYSAYLDVVLPKGYQDVLRIDNGARGEGDTVEIAIGRGTADVAYYAAFLQGLLLDNGALITSFTDANFTDGMNYLALIARDYALSVALPRASVTGKVYLENSIGVPPLVFAKGGLNYWIETWSWDLYEDELEISARTLPSASLTVQSETILESDGSTVSSASPAGSSGSGGSFPRGVNFFELDDTLVRLKGKYDYLGPRKGLIFGLNATADSNVHLEVVNVGTQADPVYALHSPLPFYSDTWISAGGVSSGGGTGGGTVVGATVGGVEVPLSGGILAFPPYPTAASLGLGNIAFKNSLAIADVANLQSALDGKQAVISDLATIREYAELGKIAHSWDNHAKAGYALASNLTAHTGNSTIHITAAERTAWNNKYDKPASGIPYTDLADGVKSALDKAHEHANKTSVLDKLKWNEDKNAIYIGDENNRINFFVYGGVASGGFSDTPGTGGGTVIGATVGGKEVKLSGGILEFDAYPTTTSLGLKSLAFKDSLAVADIIGLQGALNNKQDAATAITTANYNSYAPKLDGTGANGTWGINISGNAATSTNADTLDGYHASQVLIANTSNSVDLNEISAPSIYRVYSPNPNLPSSIFSHGNLLTVKERSSDTAWQLIGSYQYDALWFRRGTWYADGTGTLRTNAWKEIAFTDSNVASATYATSAGSVAWENVSNKPSLAVIGGDGVVEVGQYMDWHIVGSSSDYNVRLQCSNVNGVDIYLPSSNGTLALLSNIPTSLKNPYALTFGSKSYDGSSAVSLGKGDIGLENVDNTSDANKIVLRSRQLWGNNSSYGTAILTYAAGSGYPYGNLAYSDGYCCPNDAGISDGNLAVIRMGWSYAPYFHDIIWSPNMEDVWHRRADNSSHIWRKFYDSGNCNNTSTPWSASTLNASGQVTFPYRMFVGGGLQIGYWDRVNNRIENVNRPLLITSYDQPIGFGLNGNNSSIYISTTGNVGIGTSSPSAKFAVAGNTTLGGTYALGSPWMNACAIGADGYDKVVIGGAAAPTNGAIIGAHNSALNAWANLHIAGSSYIYFDFKEIRKAYLDSSGNFFATGAVTAGQASDARLKSNIVTALNACGILRSLRGVEFDWNAVATENCKDLTGHDVGLIAQEVESLIPSAIGTIWGEYKRLDYTKITPYLVEGWKAHDVEIQRLKIKIKQLEERIYGMGR